MVALVGGVNIDLMLRRNGDYFGSGAVELNPFTHCWSLGVEEQFYLIAPLAAVRFLFAQEQSSPPCALTC